MFVHLYVYIFNSVLQPSQNYAAQTNTEHSGESHRINEKFTLFFKISYSIMFHEIPLIMNLQYPCTIYTFNGEKSI